MKKTTYTAMIAASLGCAATSQAALTTGLVGYYQGEDNSNSGLASDGDSLTNAGIGTGAAGGLIGGAFSFDGTNTDDLTASTSYGSGATDLGETFTLQAWVNVSNSANPSSNSGDRMFIWESSNDYDFSLWIDEDGGTNNGGNIDGNFAMFVDDGTTSFVNVHTFAGTNNTNGWDHVLQTIVTSGGTTTVTTYINGVSGGSDTTSTAAAGEAGSPYGGFVDDGINFGRARNGAGGGLTADDRPFDGLIDEIAIWDRELSQAEITEVYNLGFSGQAIPEPSSTALIGLGSLALILRRRK